MKLFNSNVVFLGETDDVNSRTGDVYHKVNLLVDDEPRQFNCNKQFPGLKRYSLCNAQFEYREFKGDGRLYLVDILDSLK